MLVKISIATATQPLAARSLFDDRRIGIRSRMPQAFVTSKTTTRPDTPMTALCGWVNPDTMRSPINR
jgi:hypothetical protein